MDDRLQFNGAVFLEEWDDIQVAFQGPTASRPVVNGPEAEITGIEVQLDWLPTDRLRLGVALAYYDSELKDDYCNFGDWATPTAHPGRRPAPRCRSRRTSRAI